MRLASYQKIVCPSEIFNGHELRFFVWNMLARYIVRPTIIALTVSHVQPSYLGSLLIRLVAKRVQMGLRGVKD
jgi:hypothetical protein